MFIGRDHAIAAFRQALDAQLPRLILVTSGPQMGRSRLLRAFREVVQEQYPHLLLLPASADPISVDRQTTEKHFCAQVALPEVSPCAEAELSTPPGDTPRVPPSAVLILIDGYRPGPRFARWFEEQFLADLPGRCPPQLVAVAAYPSDAVQLRQVAQSVAVLELPLGSLDEQAVEAYVRALNEDTQADMGDAEIQSYTRALKDEPGLIGSLERLLRLEASANKPVV